MDKPDEEKPMILQQQHESLNGIDIQAMFLKIAQEAMDSYVPSKYPWEEYKTAPERRPVLNRRTLKFDDSTTDIAKSGGVAMFQSFCPAFGTSFGTTFGTACAIALATMLFGAITAQKGPEGP